MDTKIKKLKEEPSFIEFKKAFLLEFTRQLIIHSTHADILKLETILEKEEVVAPKPLTKKEIIRDKIRRREEIQEERMEGTRSILRPAIGMFDTHVIPEISPFRDTFKKEKIKEKKQIEVTNKPLYRNEPRPEVSQIIVKNIPYQDPFRKIELWMPDVNLPPHIQYLKPVPINKSIDLGKLNPLINNPMVKRIECYGANENIGVKGGMGAKKTAIVLTKEEIEDIINRFSKETKIPVQEGIYKVVSGRLVLLAVISSVAGIKFTINKMSFEEMNQNV